MMNLNKVMLVGNLTHDPEIRYTAKGTAVADLSIALNRTFANETGERIEETTYVDVVAWNRSAELAREYLSKGRKVYVEGRLHLDSWEDKETRQKRHKLRVVAERLDFADARPQSDPRSDGKSDTGHAEGSATSTSAVTGTTRQTTNRASWKKARGAAAADHQPQNSRHATFAGNATR